MLSQLESQDISSTWLIDSVGDFRELAEHLKKEYNDLLEDLPTHDHVSTEQILEILHAGFEEYEVAKLIESDYGRGLLMGHIATIIYIQEIDSNGEASELD